MASVPRCSSVYRCVSGGGEWGESVSSSVANVLSEAFERTIATHQSETSACFGNGADVLVTYGLNILVTDAYFNQMNSTALAGSDARSCTIHQVPQPSVRVEPNKNPIAI